MIRIAFALLLFGHALAHFPGFLVPWRLADLDELPYRTTVLSGSLDVGSTGIRLLGILWLLAALMFLLSGGLVAMHHPAWFYTTQVAICLSLLLCVLGWPDSRIGAFFNLALLAALVFGQQTGRIP